MRRIKILFVEDQPEHSQIINIFKNILSSEQTEIKDFDELINSFKRNGNFIDICHCDNFTDAYDSIGKNQYDIYVLDVKLKKCSKTGVDRFNQIWGEYKKKGTEFNILNLPESNEDVEYGGIYLWTKVLEYNKSGNPEIIIYTAHTEIQTAYLPFFITDISPRIIAKDNLTGIQNALLKSLENVQKRIIKIKKQIDISKLSEKVTQLSKKRNIKQKELQKLFCEPIYEGCDWYLETLFPQYYIEIQNALNAGNKNELNDIYEKIRALIPPVSKLIGNSKAICEIREQIDEIADANGHVLLLGETGTGKTLIAWEIHDKSRRKDKPFVEINCASYSKELIASELFGHLKGAFTGAITDKKGVLELADNGTLFIDEIGDMSSEMQASLLKAVDEQKFHRVGEYKEIKVNVRIITGTNKNLYEMVKKGSFRDDLYYRINHEIIHLPPLRERKDDIPLLVLYFIKIFEEKNKKHIDGIDDEVIKKLEEHDWKGNIRELQRLMEKLCHKVPENKKISIEIFSKNFRPEAASSTLESDNEDELEFSIWEKRLLKGELKLETIPVVKRESFFNEYIKHKRPTLKQKDIAEKLGIAPGFLAKALSESRKKNKV